MKLISLEQVFKILKPGVPLPFGVRDAKGQLLLGKGLIVPDQARLHSLLNRGMFVDIEEVKASRAGPSSSSSPVASAPKVPFGMRWDGLQRKLGMLLRASTEPGFLTDVVQAADQVFAFDEADSDQVIFLILRHDYTQYERYAESHSLHVAALCNMAARRLGWPEARRKSLIGAALTMNLSMMNLQAKLAAQTGALSERQRKDIDAHPLQSADMLRKAGLQDQDWLQAVEQHHECPDGSGYPKKLAEPTELSQLVRLCDIFAAKHSPRQGRTQLPSQQAARDLYAQSTGNPLAAALIRECGIYPPGSYVKLASGEVAVVTRRGPTAKEPIVAAITNPNGDPLSKPVARDTTQAARAVVGTVPEKSVMIRFLVEQFYPD